MQNNIHRTMCIHKKLFCSLLPLCWFGDLFYTVHEEKHIAVIIPSYNNAQWVARNLDSIIQQKYTNYHIYYLDDCSTDGTPELVTEHMRKYSMEKKLTLKKFCIREGKLKHMYELIHSLPDDCIVVQVDGDDWLEHNQAFSKINTLYSENNIWITYGQCKGWLSHKLIAQKLSLKNQFLKKFREDFRYSHMHTFYAWLFKKIDKNDLICTSIPNSAGTFYFVADDVAFMIPMLEMAQHHYACIEEVLYVYNDSPKQHELPASLKNPKIISALTQEILRKHPYKPISIELT